MSGIFVTLQGMPFRTLAVLVVLLSLLSPASAQETPSATPPPLEEAELAQYHYSLAVLRLSSLSPADRLSVMAELRTAIRLRPDFVEAHAQLGNILLQQGDTDGALDEFRLAARLAPHLPENHLALASALIAKHDWKAAATSLKEALRLDSSLPQAHYNLGTIYYTTGQLQQSIQSYREAVRLKPEFADAHYRLGLVLKLANQDKESVAALEKAAAHGMARAQYFLGNAYRSGQGTTKHLPLAIWWWMRAFEQGLEDAGSTLSQLRRTALMPGEKANKQAAPVRQAFKEYWELEWQDYPAVERKGNTETVGIALIRLGRTEDALPALLREAYAMNATAGAALEELYVDGDGDRLAPGDRRILQYFLTTAGEGVLHSRLVMALLYGKGLGVPQDLGRSKEYLKGVPEEDAKRVREELAEPAAGP